MKERTSPLSSKHPVSRCWDPQTSPEKAFRVRFGKTRVCWWKLSAKTTVDGRNPANQLRLVVYPIIYKVLAPSQVVQDFSHQQYVGPNMCPLFRVWHTRPWLHVATTAFKTCFLPRIKDVNKKHIEVYKKWHWTKQMQATKKVSSVLL